MSNDYRNNYSQEEDPEANGGSGDHSGSTVNANNRKKPEDLGEYAALDRYISTYREGGGQQDDGDDKNKKKWWQFWKSDNSVSVLEDKPSGPQVPDEWYETDIHTGIGSGDIDSRRKMFGWNELTAEKENPIAKILGYFQGPILYGT